MGTQTNLYNVSQSGSGSKTIREDVLNVDQMGSGHLIVCGNVAGSITQMGSGDLAVNGNVQGNVIQMGSGDLRITGDVYGTMSQMGSGTVNIGGSVYGHVSKLGSGDVYIRKCGTNVSNTGSGTTLNTDNVVQANVHHQIYREPQFYNNDFIHVYQARTMRLITGGARNFQEKTQFYARMVCSNAKKFVVSGLQMIYHTSVSSSNSPQKQTKQTQSRNSLNVGDKELECPVCLDIPDKEIYQCRNGHMICATCCSKIDVCPQCRCNLKIDGVLIRNRLAETLVAKK